MRSRAARAIGAELDGGRLRAVRIEDGGARPVLDVAAAARPRRGPRLLGDARLALASPRAIASVVPAAEADAVGGGSTDGDAASRLAEHLPVVAGYAAAAASLIEGGDGRTLVVAAPDDEVEAAIEAAGRHGVEARAVETAETACARLVLHLLDAGVLPAAGRSALVVVGAGAQGALDRYLVADAGAAGRVMVETILAFPADAEPPAACLDVARVVMTGAGAAAARDRLAAALGNVEVVGWAPPGADGVDLDPAWALAYAAALDGPPAVDLTPAAVRLRMLRERRARRSMRLAAAVALGGCLAAGGAAAAASWAREAAAADRGAAEVERRSLDADLARVAADVGAAEARAGAASARPPVAPVLAAIIEAPPAGVRIEEIGADDAPRAPTRFATLRPAVRAGRALAAVALVVRGTAPSYEAVEAYRAALAADPAVAGAAVVRVDRDERVDGSPHGGFRFAIEVEG